MRQPFAFGLMACLLIESSLAAACPLCPGSQTLTEEMGTMDVVAIVKLLKVLKPDDAEDLTKGTFEITQVLKGGAAAKVGEKITTIYFGEAQPGSSFLIMGIDPPKTAWSTPLQLTPRSQTYVAELLSFTSKSGTDRLKFFQRYLDDDDALLAHDAYDEFAKAPYADIKSFKPHMNRERIVASLQKPEAATNSRRLYLMMLGVCGEEQDLPLLESIMKSTNRKTKSALDATIACYLSIKGDPGMPLVEELFLKNKKADYADTYSAIMALRFHGTEGGVLKRERITAALKYMLQRPDLADLVIPDLAIWEDWSAVEELFVLFKSADEKTTWVRVPVINYLRKCPLPRAKELLKDCERLDPAAMKRANTFFPTAPPMPTRFNRRRGGWFC